MAGAKTDKHPGSVATGCRQKRGRVIADDAQRAPRPDTQRRLRGSKGAETKALTRSSLLPAQGPLLTTGRSSLLRDTLVAYPFSPWPASSKTCGGQAPPSRRWASGLTRRWATARPRKPPGQGTGNGKVVTCSAFDGRFTLYTMLTNAITRKTAH